MTPPDRDREASSTGESTGPSVGPGSGSVRVHSGHATPYADAAADYQRLGWSPVPLPYGRKTPPPSGWTGYAAPHASAADVHEWASKHAASNIGLRLPETVIGLDVDAYDGKPGRETMLAAVERLGPLPPSPRSTSRPDDQVSGIRFYRVPPGRCWADTLGGEGSGVEVIHHGHRYAVAAPSLHPEGRVYGWYAPDGSTVDPPAASDVPDLPPAWVADLDRGGVSDRGVKATLRADEVTAWLRNLPGRPEGPPCRYIGRLIAELADGLAGGASRHDTTRTYIAKMIRGGDQGHVGVMAALDTAETLLRAERKLTDEHEVERMIAGAVALCIAEPTGPLDQGCCAPEPPTLPEGPAPVSMDPGPVVDAGGRDDAAEAALDAAHALAVEVEREAYKLRVREAAREKVAAEKAAVGVVPPFDAGLLAEVLARPAEPPHRIESLIPSEAGTLIVAQRKTGKTTWQLNLARSLILGGDFLGRFTVRPITGRVGFLNFEVSAAQLARWAQEVGVPEDRLYLVNLRGRRNPFTADADREHLAEQLRAHEVESLIVDPFGRAYQGKSQNDPGEVGAWLADLDRFARGDAGVSDLILAAHAGWDGERTRGSSALEDWADVIVTLTRKRDGDDQERYLRAEGRDVLIEEDRLDFDGATRALTMSGAGSRKTASKTRQLEQLIPAVVGLVKASPGITGYGIGQELREAGQAFQKGDESKAATLAVDRGLLDCEPGPRNSRRYFLPSELPPPRPPQSSPMGTSDDLPHLLYRGEVVSGEVHQPLLPEPVDQVCPDCLVTGIPRHWRRCTDCTPAYVTRLQGGATP